MKKETVIITGVGLISPFGNTLSGFTDGLLELKKGEKDISFFTIPKYKQPHGAEVELPERIKTPRERFYSMAGQAIKNAVKDWGGELSDYSRVGLIIGSGLGLVDQLAPEYIGLCDKSVLSDFGKDIAREIGIDGEVICIASACAAGSQAISYASDLLKTGYLDIVVAGGIDIISKTAYSGFLRLLSLDESGCHPFDKNRKGIMVGEGAAFFVMQRVKKTGKLPSKIYCILAGSAVTNDAYNVVQVHPAGTQIVRAMDEAINETGITKHDIDLVIAHGTGTRINDKVESSIIENYFSDSISHMYVTAPKGSVGHTGGASGALGMMTGIGAMEQGKVPAVFGLTVMDPEVRIPVVMSEPVNHDIKHLMINAFAFGGTNVILIISKWMKEKN